MVAAPVVGYLLAYEVYPTALALFLYAGITDLADGWIARRWNMQTVVGTIVDPMADKALMTIVVVVLAIKGALPGTFSWPYRILPSTVLCSCDTGCGICYGILIEQSDELEQ